MAKTKTTDRGEKRGDPFAERIIGVLNEAGEVARKRFDEQIELGHKSTLGVHRQKKGKGKR